MSADADGFGPSNISEQISVSRETFERLNAVVACLDVWRGKMNLMGPGERGRIWRRHIWDSLQLLPLLPVTPQIVDLGSGGGFPALPLACALAENQFAHITMIETVGKKCAFLRAAVEAAGLDATVRQGRVERCADIPANTVTARAFAPLPRLMAMSAPWLQNGATGFFHKGERWKEELTDASSEWTFASEAIPSRSEGTGIILKVSEVTHG